MTPKFGMFLGTVSASIARRIEASGRERSRRYDMTSGSMKSLERFCRREHRECKADFCEWP